MYILNGNFFTFILVFGVCVVYIFELKKRLSNSIKEIKNQKENYIAVLNHDLKTPTIAQIRALELLLNEEFGKITPEQKDMLKITLDSCCYMYEMIQNQLIKCKYEDSKLSLEYSNFDLISVIEECLNESSNKLKTNSLTTDFITPYTFCPIYADKNGIKKVIINLLSNSIHNAIPASNISITLIKENDKIKLKINTKSPYIKKNEIKSFFKKYSKCSDKFNKIGIGTGFYTSKQIIEAHNGTVIAESKKGEFNTLGFNIPMAV